MTTLRARAAVVLGCFSVLALGLSACEHAPTTTIAKPSKATSAENAGGMRALIAAAKREGVPRVVLAGGVSANSRLRARIGEEGSRSGIQVHLPSRALCTDNAAMVAFLGERRLSTGHRAGPDLNAYAASRFPR